MTNYLRLICTGLIVIILNSCNSSPKNTFQLKGNLSNAAGETLVLEQIGPNNLTVIDSVKVDEKGDFAFENTRIPQMDFYRIKTSAANFAILVMDSTQQITFTADAKQLGKTCKVEGSPDTKQFIALNTLLQQTFDRLDSLKRGIQTTMTTLKMDSLKMDSLNAIAEAGFMSIMDKDAPVVVKQIEYFPASIANFCAFDFVDIKKYMPMYEKVLQALTEKYANSAYTKRLKSNIDLFKQQAQSATEPVTNNALNIGAAMPEITLPNPDGNLMKLSSLKGKVVLIDFWASWCKPCRMENPNVLNIYNKYHAQGFEVFGVSLDEEKESWVNAIHKDGLPWTQVSDLKGWSSPLCSAYNINSIPFTVLLDRNGNIAAKTLRGENLAAKVAELISR